tara:strand:- start:1701 stop:2744 length:1044 start_codon:yes stop_codon:yes gene_type:complete
MSLTEQISLNKLQSRSIDFSSSICSWYKKNGRENLSWRSDVTPYRIWISEIMLQQTQVKTVIPYFEKFILRFPDLEKISLATEEEILALWTGLGFYRRAKNIFRAKEIIKKEYKNIFPSTFEEIISLPGVGRSTAGAILSIAFKKPFPILDANVKRVISRYDKIDLYEKKSIDVLWQLSKLYTPKKKIFEYTQGIMDIGATVCSSKDPLCSKCPIKSSCKSAFMEIEYIKKIKKAKKVKEIYFTLAHSKNNYLLFKKNKKSFWESLWIPYEDINNKSRRIFKKPNKVDVKQVNHTLSHLDLDITIEIFDYKKPFQVNTKLEHQWINKEDIKNFGLPKPIKHIIENHV